MTGETNLQTILASMRVTRREAPVTVVSVPSTPDAAPVALGEGVLALMEESEGTTVVATIEEAERRGWDTDFQAAWLTIEVHTSLSGVGLTAAMATALTERGISCNVLAGYFHDHLLIPLDQADEAITTLHALSDAEA